MDPDALRDAENVAGQRAKNAGLLLAYENSGYDNTQPGRLPDLLPHVSVKRIKEEMGADAVKILIYYTPFDDPKVNDIKHAFVEQEQFGRAHQGAREIDALLNTVGQRRDDGVAVGADMEEVQRGFRLVPQRAFLGAGTGQAERVLEQIGTGLARQTRHHVVDDG